jgi:hydroxymethylpyrimidine/phosphomethylpyrimidine kinase
MVHTMPNRRPVVLTIAGFDPSGGAGIVADTRTIAALGCFPAAALTSITFQNTTGVFGAEHQSASTLNSQLQAIVQDLEVAAVKTGMLPTAEIVAEVVRCFSEMNLPAPVIDPVLISTSGHDLISDGAYQLLKMKLLRIGRLVTPNIPEAERLAGFSIANESDMRLAAEAIQGLGTPAVLVKGGHRGGARNQGRVAGAGDAVDILLDEAGNFTEFREEFVDAGEIHGSGCTLSAAIAACLARGTTLEEAVRVSKRYVTEAIRALREAPRIGHGARPI